MTPHAGLRRHGAPEKGFLEGFPRSARQKGVRPPQARVESIL